MCKQFALLLAGALVLSIFPSSATLALRAPLPVQLSSPATGGEPPPALAQAGVAAGAWQRMVEQIRADQVQSGGDKCASASDWTEQKKLLGIDGAANDRFGWSAAIWGDVVIVGVYGDDIASSADQGSVYLFGRNQGGVDNWGEIIQLIASDGAAGDEFGWSVAIFGDTVVVGAQGDDSRRGSAYLFARNQGGADHWGQIGKLTGADGVAGDQFGRSVAICGDTVVVGAEDEDSSQGSAYLFGRNQGGADNWGQIIKLTASDGATDDWFGIFVAIWGDTVVVGAAGDDSSQGSAYLFARNQGGADHWGQVKKLTASDGAVGGMFGMAVALSGDTVVVGAPGDRNMQGSAYLFARNRGGADNWGQVKKLTASDGVMYDLFGCSVAIWGDTVVVGAGGDDSFRGSAYIFARNLGWADHWGQISKLTASDGANDSFGESVAIWGDTVVVGAPDDDIDSNANQGLAYVFTAPCTPELELRERTASDGAINDDFGYSVATWGDSVVIGAIRYDNFRGAAYVFASNQGGPGNWGQVKKLTASDGAEGDWFGAEVAIWGDTVVVGAYHHGNTRGSAYLFARNQGGANNWGQLSKLTASDGAAGDYFGASVAIWGNTVVVGAGGDDGGKGSAYLFARNQGGADNWGQLSKLTASDGAAYDRFGGSVAIWGDTIVIGAVPYAEVRGSVYLFARNQGGADNWGEVKKLTASDGEASDFFGRSVALWGDTVVVGAYGDDNYMGSAYLFARNQGGTDNWGQVKKLTAAAGGWFGVSVGIWGDTVVVGAYRDGDNSRGAAYLYGRNQGGADNWGELKKLTASDSAARHLFGYSADIWGDTVVVGAYGDYGWQGSAYVFGCAQPPSFGVYLPLAVKGYPL